MALEDYLILPESSANSATDAITSPWPMQANSLCSTTMSLTAIMLTTEATTQAGTQRLDEADWFGRLYVEAEQVLLAAPMLPLASQDTVPCDSGVYLLYYNEVLKYIGSTEGLRGRLSEHRRSVQSASRLDLGQTRYRFVVVEKHAAKAIESRLIAHYNPTWNHSGFGSKAHGKGRRHQRSSKWDETHGRARPSATAPDQPLFP